ncbi:hypothetical protein GCM10022226_50620 [Sphaerisporangium flaviroseum]|uniref:DUF2267 domain-containing protein n=1 Tax=Sphaerisporangium flaviroseum TaxID=509199 RepID=A0ABP7IQC0_9ACTN
MDYDRFLSIIQREAGVDRQAAEAAARATLRTLAERLSNGQTRDLAEQLPPEAARWLPVGHQREKFHADEFLRRVAEREGTDVQTAERHAVAVFAALSRAVTAKEFEDAVSELPKDFWPLIEKGRRPEVPVMPYEEFLSRVADRAGLDEEGARRAAEAVLETLAERIAGGEVRDLIKELPPELGPALERGKERTHGVARAMSLDEFLALVAEREGVSVDQAREHARAVLSTVGDAVTEKEFHDLTSELPRVYIEEFAHA